MKGPLYIFLYAILSLGLATTKAHAQIPGSDTLNVYFAFNSHNINQQAADGINSYLNHLESLSMTIASTQITGHTDTVGLDNYNMRLSVDRARSVRDYLAGRLPSLANGEVSILGMGKKSQTGNTDSLNRKAEVVFFFRKDPAQTEEKAAAKEVDTTFSLDNIYFIENTAVLTGSSTMALPSILRQLNKYRTRTVLITGNCNSSSPILTNDDPLFKLSVKRAKLIYDLLVEAGFNPNKMSYKGVGNSAPKNPDAVTADQMRANMRVEVTVYK